MDRVYNIDKEKLTASLKEYGVEAKNDISVHIDSEEHRIWFEGISFTEKPWVENAFYSDLFGEIITDENDLAFIGEIIDIKNEIAKQIIEGIEHNIETYNSTLEQIDKDTALHHEDNALATAIQGFQNAVASYLNNENISRYSWGTENLADFVRDCVRVDNKVAVSVNDHNFDISVSLEMDGKEYLKTEEGMTDREIAEEMVRRADYFLTNDEYIQGNDTLYDLALDVVRYDETVKQIEGAKDNLAIVFVKANGDKDKLIADNDLYFEWFKDTFGHSFGKDNGYDDEAMLNHRFAQMVEDGRVPSEKVFSASVKGESDDTYDYYAVEGTDKYVVVYDSSSTEHEVALISKDFFEEEYEKFTEADGQTVEVEMMGEIIGEKTITVTLDNTEKECDKTVDEVTAEAPKEKPNISEIKAPSVITAYSMTLINKANEIKELIDNCAIRSDEKGRQNVIEIWSDINDRGDNVGNIRIVNGGEAIKLSYKEQECTGAYYNDHIFQKNLGEWKPATEVFDADGMKKPLYDIFSHLLQQSEFNPRLADDEVKNQNRNKGNTAPKR